MRTPDRRPCQNRNRCDYQARRAAP
jgi:hypothetical protein